MQNPYAKVVANELESAAAFRALVNNIFYAPKDAKSAARRAVERARIWREMGEREAKRNAV